jgi:hypothetical protein
LRFLEIVCSLDDCAAKTAGEEPIDLLIVFYDALLNQIVIQESPFQNEKVMGVDVLLPDAHCLFQVKLRILIWVADSRFSVVYLRDH